MIHTFFKNSFRAATILKYFSKIFPVKRVFVSSISNYYESAFCFSRKKCKNGISNSPSLTKWSFFFLSKKCDFLVLLIGFDSFKKVPSTSAPIIKSGEENVKRGVVGGRGAAELIICSKCVVTLCRIIILELLSVFFFCTHSHFDFFHYSSSSVVY